MEASGSPESWAVEYANAGWEELLKEADEITAYIEPLTREELARRYEVGEFELLSTNGRMPGNGPGPQVLPGVEWVAFDAAGGIRRYRVPESQYPDLYALARKGAWLLTHGHLRKRQEERRMEDAVIAPGGE